MQERPQNRNLVGATVNAPGAELANSSQSHECIVGLDQSCTAGGEEELELSLSCKKEKRSKSKSTRAIINAAPTQASKDYSYAFLLNRLYEQHGDSGDRRARRMELPVSSVGREGSCKTVLHNFTETVEAISSERQHKCNETCTCVPLKDHMQLFFSVKLGVLCNVAPATHRAGSERLVIRCKCPPERIHSLLKEYVQVFVESPCTKGSYDTRLERDPVTKLMSVVCNSTGSRHCVETLKQAVQAVTKADRKKRRKAHEQ